MRFQKLTNYLDSFESEFGVPALDCIIWKSHRRIYRHKAGFSDPEKNRRVHAGDLYWAYSVTKVATAVAAMQLLELGKIALDDPVAKYLPAYEHLQVKTERGVRPAENPMTIRHLFSMQGGLDYRFDAQTITEILRETGETATTRQIAEALVAEPLCFEPGTHFQYSFCMDVLGAVIETVTGVTLGNWMQRNLFDPLGMKHTGFHLNSAGYEMLSAQYRMIKPPREIERIAKDNFYHLSPNFEGGGGGLYSTADDLILLADALACGGAGHNGYSILSRASVERMKENLLDTNSLADFRRRYQRPGYGYGFGVHVCLSPDNPEPAGTFGWDGAAGAHVLIDSRNEISAVYFQHVLDMKFIFDDVFPVMDRLIYEGIGANY